MDHKKIMLSQINQTENVENHITYMWDITLKAANKQHTLKSVGRCHEGSQIPRVGLKNQEPVMARMGS